jgi:hypothetical protein
MLFLAQGKYIDTSLVTCAEYQPFLDEKRAQQHFRQPDHWTTFSFPAGSGDAPVLGVRQSDARAFCTWLTARDREGWSYRLPSPGEWPVKERAGWKALQAEVGYWTEEKHHLEWARGKPPEAIPGRISLLSIGLDLDSIVEDDLSSSASGLAHDLSFLDRNLANAHDVAQDIDCILHTRDSELGSARAIAQDIIAGTDQRLKGVDREIADPIAISAYDLTNECASDIIQSIDRILAHNLLNADQEVVEAWYPGQEIDRILAHDFYVNDFLSLFANARNRACELVSPRALGALSHDFRFRAHNLARARELASIIERQCMLLLLQMRLVGQYPAYEGILLVKERQQE